MNDPADQAAGEFETLPLAAYFLVRQGLGFPEQAEQTGDAPASVEQRLADGAHREKAVATRPPVPPCPGVSSRTRASFSW